MFEPLEGQGWPVLAGPLARVLGGLESALAAVE